MGEGEFAYQDYLCEEADMEPDGRTHHAECWRDHLDCAGREIERCKADIARLYDLPEKVAKAREFTWTYYRDLAEKLAAERADAFDLLAGTSLCEGCQKKREERRIIATPRIRVEEERDALRAEVQELRARLGESNV